MMCKIFYSHSGIVYIPTAGSISPFRHGMMKNKKQRKKHPLDFTQQTDLSEDVHKRFILKKFKVAFITLRLDLCILTMIPPHIA